MVLDEHGRVDAERSAEEEDFRRDQERDRLAEPFSGCVANESECAIAEARGFQYACSGFCAYAPLKAAK